MPTHPNIQVGGVEFNPADFSGVSAANAAKMTVAAIVAVTVPVVGALLAGIITALGIRGSTQHLPPSEAARMAAAFKDRIMGELDAEGFPYGAKVNGLYPHQMLSNFGINWINNPTTALPPLSLGRAEFAVEMRSVGDPNSANRKASFAGGLWSIANMIYRNGDAETLESESGAQLQFVLDNALSPMWAAIKAGTVDEANGQIATWLKPVLIFGAIIAAVVYLPRLFKRRK